MAGLFFQRAIEKPFYNADFRRRLHENRGFTMRERFVAFERAVKMWHNNHRNDNKLPDKNR